MKTLNPHDLNSITGGEITDPDLIQIYLDILAGYAQAAQDAYDQKIIAEHQQ
jgi:hypothetical protein